MTLLPGSHALGPESGSLSVRTYREGLAQKVGHDLVLTVRSWRAEVAVADDGRISGVTFDADPDSLEITDSANGVKPLTARDRGQIDRLIRERVLGGRPIALASSRVDAAGGRLSVSGDLSLAGVTRPVRFDVPVGDDGRADVSLPLIQSEWGIRPYTALMGALKLRDAVEVRLEFRLPAA